MAANTADVFAANLRALEMQWNLHTSGTGIITAPSARGG